MFNNSLLPYPGAGNIFMKELKMGHIVNQDREYRLLQQRLDRNVTGAPDMPVFINILKILFSPEEAEFARKIPSIPTEISELSKKTKIPEGKLLDKLLDMAGRGLVVDIYFEERHMFMLNPVVIGFFEFTFMRTRGNMPMKELAGMFEEYMHADDRFARSLFAGQTQLGRILVREEAVADSDFTEILDWDRASNIVTSSPVIGVSLCSCRHKASHLGKACESPQEACLTLNYAAESLISNGIARRISTDEAMGILRTCKEKGLVQTGDNVREKPTYICNCCGCCCGMISAIKTFDIRNAIVASGWVMNVDKGRCKGCRKCEKACPLGAIELHASVASCDETLCFGCGVCYTQCRNGAISMKFRGKRSITPETLFDRIVAMSIERGKLAELIFDDREKLSHRAFGRIFSVLEKSPPFKAAMAIKPLRSAFMKKIVEEAVKKTGNVSKIMI